MSLLRQRFFVVLVVLVAMFIFFSLTQETFLTGANISAILTASSILWVASIGLTFVMLAGGFDLSIGSMLALCGIGLGWFVNQASMPIGLAILATVVMGLLLGGLVNGVLIGRFGLSFLVVTLGSLILFRGLTNYWSQSKTEQVISPFLDNLAFGSTLGIPNPVWVMAITYAVMLYVQKFTFFGRDVYAVGGNVDAARLSGIRTSRTIVIVYALSGGFAALAAVLQDARIGAASPQVGENLVFSAAAAVLLGGTSFSGGVGGVTGTAVGVLFLGVLQNGLSVAGIESYWQQIITGVILIGAIALDFAQRKGLAGFTRRSSAPAPLS
ncbi:MAG: ABC transporter permease [Actinomycetales bacterium]|jgi:ribose/xylose/arabinose/galactoside ABC-type transport system permease subunit